MIGQVFRSVADGLRRCCFLCRKTSFSVSHPDLPVPTSLDTFVSACYVSSTKGKDAELYAKYGQACAGVRVGIADEHGWTGDIADVHQQERKDRYRGYDHVLQEGGDHAA